MRLCSYRRGEGRVRAGIAIGETVHDLADAVGALGHRAGKVPAADFGSLLGLLAGGPAALDVARRAEESLRAGAAAGSGTPLSEVKLLAPLPRPNTIRDFLLFPEHLENCMHTMAKHMFPPAAWANALVKRAFGRPLIRPPRSWVAVPAYYKGNPDTVIGPGDQVVWPSYTKQLDYELEFGLYILGRGKDVKEAEAGRLIAGYTVFNDFSCRDIQMTEMAARLGPAKGKDFDTGNAMGPFLVTPDEVGDPYRLKLEAFVNGERWSSGSSAGMRMSFEEVIAYISRSETLHPGDFLGSGTVGTGCGLELDRWLKPGDTVKLVVEKLGELENRVVSAGGASG